MNPFSFLLAVKPLTFAEKFQDIHQEREQEMELSGEGIETIVCKNLYEHIFLPHEQEVKLGEIIAKHQTFIKP